MGRLNSLTREIRHAFRTLRNTPGFSLVAILTLALGIGANTAIFSALQGVVLSPLPYPQPDRLVLVLLYNRALGYATDLSYPDFRDWQRDARCFEGIAAFTPFGFDVTNPGTPAHLEGKQVSAGFFRTLGVKPSIGRELSPEEDRNGGLPAVIISDRLWRDRFAGSPSALGKVLTLSGKDYTIVGVLPPDFRFLNEPADVFTAIGPGDPLTRDDRTVHNVASIARLSAGVSLAQARAEMGAVQERIDQLNPLTERGLGVYLEPMKQLMVGDIGGTLKLLLGAVSLVLLIACANVANLLLARSSSRTREIAVRLALGASRVQIVRQLAAENLLLSLAGGVLGLAIAKWGLPLALATVPGSLPRSENIRLDLPVLFFAFGISAVVGIVFGLLPALRSSKVDLLAGLKEGGRGLAAGNQRMQRLLVVMQVALALILLAGGSLLLRTIGNLWKENPGFDTHNVTTLQVGLSPALTATPDAIRIAYQQLTARLRGIAGVEAADITALLPLGQGDNSGPFWVGSRQPASMAEIPRAIYYWTGPDYLRVMNIPLLRGRFVSTDDNIQSQPVVAVDSILARTYFPNRDPIGQTLTIPHWGAARIVGVVGHVEQWGPQGSGAPEKPEIYASFYQLSDQWVPSFRTDLTLAIRSPLELGKLLPAVKREVYGAAADQPVYNIRSMRDLVSGSMAPQRLAMVLLVVFAILALLLAAIGIYGVISYSMARRVRELGIRMALGASKGDVLRMVLGQALRLALAGVVMGTIVALALTRLLAGFSRLLYGVRASDPVTLLAVSALLMGAALLASFVPARRAAGMDPMHALRQE